MVDDNRLFDHEQLTSLCWELIAAPPKNTPAPVVPGRAAACNAGMFNKVTATLLFKGDCHLVYHLAFNISREMSEIFPELFLHYRFVTRSVAEAHLR